MGFCRITVAGHLDPTKARWFEGLTVTPLECGRTQIEGLVPDQAALHAVLTRLRDLGIELLSLETGGVSK
jgi:hypothetical protein